nr:MAG TPA: hypothetical protein [Caudoviricetes sp.]
MVSDIISGLPYLHRLPARRCGRGRRPPRRCC